jgi:hypothetical protein
MLKSLDKI